MAVSNAAVWKAEWLTTLETRNGKISDDGVPRPTVTILRMRGTVRV